MSYTSRNDDLIKLVKELNTEDSVWLLHVINKDTIEFESRIDIEDEHDPQLMDKDIDKLNSIKDLNELKNYLIDGLKDKTETFSETIMAACSFLSVPRIMRHTLSVQMYFLPSL